MIEAIQFLFPPFVACFVILAILGYLGVHVLEREIIFIDVALAQIAAVGSALSLFFFHGHSHEHEGVGFEARLLAIGCTFIAAAFFAFVSKKIARISQETVIGVSYAIAAAATLFLLAMATGGDVHMEEMLTGSLLWVQWPSIMLCASVYAAAGIFHYVFRSRFIRISTDYHEAEKSGINVMLWDFLFYASMGVVITYTVEIAGVLVTFAFLIIPATFSAMFAQSWRNRLLIAWGLGIAVSIAGLAFSYRFDFSCGPSMVSIMGIVLVIGAIGQKLIKSS